MGARKRGKSVTELKICAWLCAVLISTCESASVSDVQPRSGSLGGETRLTISGSGFSADQFSQDDDPDTGNRVYLVSSSGSTYDCTVLKDGTTETQIMCYTQNGMPEEDHYVKVVVDGVQVPDSNMCNGNPSSSSCTYKPKQSNTPTITSLSSQSGTPGGMIEMNGKLFTDRYGSNLATASNGKTEKLLRVYVGPQDCDLKNNDDFYGLQVEETSDNGVLKCKAKGSSVGFFNATFLVESPYGRSVANGELYRVSYNDVIYLHQTYTDITNISHSEGSKAGGLKLTIYGRYFDERLPYSKAGAFVGDTVCDVTNVVTNEYIECIVAADPQYTASKFEGNRGVNFEYWTSTSKGKSELDSILSLGSSDSGYNSTTLDDTYFYDVNGMDTYASRMTSYFRPPHTGDYEFQLLADDGARLYVDGTETVTSTRSWSSSARIRLEKNRRYLLQVTHYENGGDSYIHLRAKFFDTEFTNSWTAKAEQEMQTIEIKSTVKFDEQQLAFTRFTGRTHTQEVQKVTITQGENFRLGLWGVYTEPLMTSMEDSMIQTALGSLPIWGTEESILVERNPSDPPSYQLTFNSKRGDFPMIEVKSIGNSSEVRATVTQETRGVPDLDMASLLFDDVVSEPFSVDSLDTGTLEDAITGMFSAECPAVFKSESKMTHYESFESGSSSFWGARVMDTEPFCGRYVLKNPYRIYRQATDEDIGIMLSMFGTVCFAYKGFLASIMGVKYSYRDNTDQDIKTKNLQFSYQFQTDSDTVSETWYYTCVDVYDKVRDARPDDTEHRLLEVWVYRANGGVDAFVDSLFIGREATTDDAEVHLRRRRPALPNNNFVDRVSVSSVSTDTYKVTIVPINCGFDFPLFELANGRPLSNSIGSSTLSPASNITESSSIPSANSTVTTTSSPQSSANVTTQVTSGVTSSSGTTATLALDNGGGSGVMTVTRTTEASPPVTGFVDVSFNGHERKNINVSLEAEQFGKELESIQGIGALSVTKNGDCANFDMVTTFVSLPGDLVQMEVSYDRLQGIDATGSIATDRHGGLFYDPLTGDMVSTVHSSPQVRLYINDIPTACNGDCSFNWVTSSTPTISGINPQTGTASLSTSAVITGTGFSSVMSENHVTIGGVECTVRASIANSITCDVGNGPVGPHSVIVTVDDKGYAEGSVQFTYTASISSLSPSSGSLGGGGNLTINGYGFRSGANVTINSNKCPVVSLQADTIVCLVPHSTSAGTYDVVVDQESSSLTYSGYTYSSGLTATVNNVVPSTIDVNGGSITITGSSFSSNNGSVFVGEVEASVISWSDSEIEISVDEVYSGSQELKIEAANGYAVKASTFELPTVNVDLKITNVHPLKGSLKGGTKLTITGSGFGTDDTNVVVKVGAVNCQISSVTNTQILCEIEDAGTTHYVTNRGVDRAFGVYYAFDQPFITINEGDYVNWSWETPAFVNDIAHSIKEVDSPSAVVAKEGGFSSGNPTSDGSFKHQFVKAGRYYVWSGYVDIYGIKNYHGTIEVVTAESTSGEINVKVGKAEALHDVGGASNPSDGTSCQSVTSGKQSCTDSEASVNDTTKFSFSFWTCSTPVVNSVSVNNGTTKTDIIISGEGFSNTNCQNEVSFGGIPCNVTVSSEDSLTCHLENSGEPELGILHQIELRVHNRGKARINIIEAKDSGFAVIPNIVQIAPTFGSLAGGARLTISGYGFGNLPFVKVDGYPCNIITNAYNEIVCETPSHTVEGEKTVTVEAFVNGVPLPAECETFLKKCLFSYATLYTPSVSAILPSSMSGTTTFTVTGASLGTNIGEVSVTFGNVEGTVTSVNGTTLLVDVANIPAGNNAVFVRVKDYGKASGSLSVSGTLTVDQILPSSGSIHGNTKITIKGNGFVNTTTVSIDGTSCAVESTSLSEVICISQSHNAGTATVSVTSNGISESSSSFNYASGSTPTITSLNPTFGVAGQTLNITGSNLSGGTVTVTIGQTECDFISGNADLIMCTVGNHSTGMGNVLVHIEDLGDSNSNIEFEYQLGLNTILPIKGGTAGGQTVVLDGTGFDDSAEVTICGQKCQETLVTSSAYTCKTPANTNGICDVSISLNGLTKTLPRSYTYDSSLTPSISGVSPRRGGTGGGTSLTITGSGFGIVAGDVTVEIDGIVCVVSNVVDTEIECVTGPHQGSTSTKVEVQVSGNGIAEENSSDGANFEYIDVWSSLFTWGGGPLPQAGEFVIIPAGMTLLLDMDTPILSFLLIQGGTLVFDEKDIELQSNIIMITDGGSLQVGTENQPFQHKAIITLHGHHRSKELPIYGTKVLAVRNGTLDLHGIEVPLTWTRLASTSAKGTNTLELVDPVEWNVGDEIVIASTGHHQSQSENEKKTITNISLDKRTLTLDSALDAEHVGVEETFDGTLVEMRGEVGLLTHNVVVRGNQDPQWEDEIKACAAGFNVGEFAVQTCFQGRFGDEIGSSQFGAMILVHAPVYDTHEAQARISYVEVTFAGQAFRLGRYPIHFHLNGDMSTSYVRGCGIHKTFNRAVNIHGTHNTLVEKTVIYNIMGGAFFLEDGIETGNTIQYNLAVFVIASSSLLNDDVTPASFWVTNPNNTIQHNAAAGGTHFGYWYRMHNHPDGPSFTTSVCPVVQPLGIFRNNSAHSFGWFGLWIFESYFPRKGGCGGSEVEPAVFESLFAWNNEKGAESVNTGALQFVDFILVQNKVAGYECKSVSGVPRYTDDSPMVRNGLIVGKTTVQPLSQQGCTTAAVVLPMGYGFRIIDTRFVNFAESCFVFGFAKITGTCSFGCGGFIYHIEGLKYVNAPKKASYGWEWEGILLDKDGTTTGKSGNWTILPTSGTIPSDCEAASEFSYGKPGSMCPSKYKWHRFAFNEPTPKSLEGKDFIFTNQYGNSSVPFLKKRITHKPGWMCAFLSGATYKYHFENAAQIRNISFNGRFDEFGSEDYIFVELDIFELPDRFTIDGGKTFINATVGGIDPSTAKNGDWEWDNVNNKIKFIVHGRQRSRRSVGALTVDNSFSFSSFKCYYDNCIPPPDPRTIPPAISRPLSYDYWDDETVWNLTAGYVTNVGFNGTQIPQDYENIRILLNTWMMVNMTSMNKIGTLLIEGVLEFGDHPAAQYIIEADFIIIKGGRLIIGWPDDPFDGIASIILRGNHSSSYYNPGIGPTLGSKAIGVFGGLDLFGKDVGQTWTELAATADANSNTITLSEQVQWSVGDDIVIGSTSFDAWQTESFRITAISSDNITLTLNETLKYKHIAHNETLSNGLDISMGAAVGLLSRNIKILGEDYDKLYRQSHGARVLIGLVVDQGETYAGYARLSNVEFYHTGQEGFTEEYDPRFSVAFVAVGTVNDIRPSMVTKCSFHNGFNTAIGAYGIGSLNITDNVVFGAIGNGIATNSDDTVLKHNLVALMVATNSYQDRLEEFNPRWEAGIEAMSAKRLILQDNLVTASERIAYHVPLLECDDTSGDYYNNKMYSNLLGAVILPEDPTPSGCAKMSGFIAWKSHDIGLYYQSGVNFVSENNLLIENTNGLLAIVNGPGILSHVYADKRVEIKNTTFVGQTSSFDCVNDKTPSPDDNIVLSSNSRPSSPPGGGMVGIVFPTYISKGNSAPIKPFIGSMSYNTIGGLSTISDVTFAKYGQTACKNNYAVTTSVANDDLQHPMASERTTLIEVDSSHKIIYHRPNVGKINSADCVDMDCDALKKAMFKDLDGTFLGHVGTIIPQSEYEWGGDPRRGLGDYRIPKEMVTTLDGVRIPYNTIAPNKGVIRSENCTYQSSMQAYECFEDMNYEMLVIESMDSDTETRRLSPVAILGDGYIDLINGPQDHGWCSGYTCRKRVSTFHALVATDHEYLIHFTSTTPKHMRYRLLNVDANEGIKLTVWYSRPNRLDVFVNGQFKIATNARIDSNQRYIITMPQGNEYEPQLANGTGTNYYDKDRGEITFIIMGPQQIDIKTSETIIVSFGLPALTVSDFYGENLVENLAAFLNIPLTKVRIMNVVSAAGSGRRKRSSNGITVEVEIGDEPASDVNSTASDSIDYTSLVNLASNIVNECQVGNVSQTLNITGGCQTVELPSTDPSVASIKYNTPSPDHLFFYSEPVADYEGILLTTQPRIRAADISNNVITELGTAEYPWQMTVSVRDGTGHPSNNLSGILIVNCSDGWFNFSDLAISHMGTGYILDFNVTYPPEAENFTLATDPFDVAGRPLKVNIYDKTSGDITTNSQFSVILDLRDTNTNEAITEIDWRDHTWTAEVSMLASSDYGSLAGTTTLSFDTTSGRVMFPDLSLTGYGTFYLQFRAVSDPPDFNLTMNQKMAIKNPAHIGMTIEETYDVKVKFNVDYNKVLPTEDKQLGFEQMLLTEFANVWPDVYLSVGSIYEGSIIVTFTISGSSANVNATAYSMCDSIYNKTTYAYNGYSLNLSPYLTINNQAYYGVVCGEISDDGDDKGMELYLIIIIVLLCLLVVGVVAGILIWKCNVKPKTKTHDWRSGTLYNGEQKPENYLFREDTFVSMGFNSAKPPAATGMHHLNEKRPLSSFSVRINTPEPKKEVKTNERFNTQAHDIITPPPAYDTPAMYVEPCGDKPKKRQMDHLRSPSPSSSNGSQSPKLTRSHSPFEGRDSPMPPVGEFLYQSDYITTPARSATPHLPAPSPNINRKKKARNDLDRFHMYH